MALRSGHGNGAGVPRIECLPADELPEPVAGPLPDDARPVARQRDGRFVPGNPAARLGGLARARRVRLVDSLGLRKIADDATFKPYRDAAEEFVSHHLGQLAVQAGGKVGAAPSSMVASAALQLAASRWAFDKGATTEDASLMKLGSSLANDSRQNLLAAYELAVREAKARAESPGAGAPWMQSPEGER